MGKILILANDAGGLYNFRFELIEKLIEENFEVYFSVPQLIDYEKVELIVEAGGKYIHTPINRRGMNPLEDLKLINDYKRIFKEIRPNLVLTYTIKPNIYGNYVANKFEVPTIMNITGIGSSLTNGNLKKIIKLMYRYATNKSVKVFFQNENNRSFFIDNNLVKKNKTVMVPGSGVNIKKFIPMEGTSKNNKIIFLFIGRLMKEKGMDEYLKAANNIIEKHSNVEFQILGRIEEESYKKIISNNKSKQIKYLGRSDDVRNEIKEVACIVNPSYHEGMSNVLLEGAAMGKPLIASNIPGCKEIIDDGINGFLSKAKSAEDLEEKLIKFIELDSKTKEVMGEKSREKVVKEFDRNIVVSKYMKTIESIIGEGV